MAKSNILFVEHEEILCRFLLRIVTTKIFFFFMWIRSENVTCCSYKKVVFGFKLFAWPYIFLVVSKAGQVTQYLLTLLANVRKANYSRPFSSQYSTCLTHTDLWQQVRPWYIQNIWTHLRNAVFTKFYPHTITTVKFNLLATTKYDLLTKFNWPISA